MGWYGDLYKAKGGDDALEQKFTALKRLMAEREMIESADQPTFPEEAFTALFKVADILNRPLYAVTGAVDTLLATDPKTAELPFLQRALHVPSRMVNEFFSGVGGLEGQKEFFGDILEQAGVPEMGRLSDLTGEDTWLARKGFDPTFRGFVGLAMDIRFDPLMAITRPLGGAKRIMGRTGEVKALKPEARRLIVESTDEQLNTLAKQLDIATEGVPQHVWQPRVYDALAKDKRFLERHMDTLRKIPGMDDLSEIPLSSVKPTRNAQIWQMLRREVEFDLFDDIAAGNRTHLLEVPGIRYRPTLLPKTSPIFDMPVMIDQGAAVVATKAWGALTSMLQKTAKGQQLLKGGAQAWQDAYALFNRVGWLQSRLPGYKYIEEEAFMMRNAAETAANMETQRILSGMPLKARKDKELIRKLHRLVESPRSGPEWAQRMNEFTAYAKQQGVEDPMRIYRLWQLIARKMGRAEAAQNLIDPTAWKFWAGRYLPRAHKITGEDALAQVQSYIQNRFTKFQGGELGGYNELRSALTFDDFEKAMIKAGKQDEIVWDLNDIIRDRIRAHSDNMLRHQFAADIMRGFGPANNPAVRALRQNLLKNAAAKNPRMAHEMAQVEHQVNSLSTEQLIEEFQKEFGPDSTQALRAFDQALSDYMPAGEGMVNRIESFGRTYNGGEFPLTRFPGTPGTQLAADILDGKASLEEILQKAAAAGKDPAEIERMIQFRMKEVRAGRRLDAIFKKHDNVAPLRELLDEMFENTSNAELKPIIARIRDYIPDDLPVVRHEGDDFIVKQAHKKGRISDKTLQLFNMRKTSPGVYWAESDSILLGYEGATERTLLHEAIHAATSKLTTQAGYRLGGKTAQVVPASVMPAVKKAADDLNDLRAWWTGYAQNVRNVYKNQPQVGSKRVALKRGEGGVAFLEQWYANYALKNVDEFIAVSMSDPRLQQIMAATPLSKAMAQKMGLAERATIWDAFVELVRRVLGMEVSSTTLLEAVMKKTDELLEAGAGVGSKRPRLRQEADDAIKSILEKANRPKGGPPPKKAAAQVIDDATQRYLLAGADEAVGLLPKGESQKLLPPPRKEPLPAWTDPQILLPAPPGRTALPPGRGPQTLLPSGETPLALGPPSRQQVDQMRAALLERRLDQLGERMGGLRGEEVEIVDRILRMQVGTAGGKEAAKAAEERWIAEEYARRAGGIEAAEARKLIEEAEELIESAALQKQRTRYNEAEHYKDRLEIEKERAQIWRQGRQVGAEMRDLNSLRSKLYKVRTEMAKGPKLEAGQTYFELWDEELTQALATLRGSEGAYEAIKRYGTEGLPDWAKRRAEAAQEAISRVKSLQTDLEEMRKAVQGWIATGERRPPTPEQARRWRQIIEGKREKLAGEIDSLASYRRQLLDIHKGLEREWTRSHTELMRARGKYADALVAERQARAVKREGRQIERELKAELGKPFTHKALREKNAADFQKLRPAVQASLMYEMLGEVRTVEQLDDLFRTYEGVWSKIPDDALREARAQLVDTDALKNVQAALAREPNNPFLKAEAQVIQHHFTGLSYAGQPLRTHTFTKGPLKGVQVDLPQGIVDDFKNFEDAWMANPEVKRLIRHWDFITNAFKLSVTKYFPDFNARNQYSNTGASAIDIALQALNPKAHAEAIGIMIASNPELRRAVPRWVWDRTLVTHSGRKMTYVEVGELMKGYGTYVDRMQLLETTGFSKAWDIPKDSMHYIREMTETSRPGISKAARTMEALADAPTLVENEARALHFVALIRRDYAPADAMMNVNQFLFDYSSLSAFERNFMRRIIPFYTWTRKNVQQQIWNLYNRPGRVAVQTRPLTMDRGPEADVLPDFMRGGMRVRLSQEGDKGATYITNIDLPIANLDVLWAGGVGKTLREHLNMIHPFLKMPLELAIGKDTFDFQNVRGRKWMGRLGPSLDRNLPKPIKEWLELEKIPLASGEIAYKANAAKIYALNKFLFLGRFMSSQTTVDEFVRSVGSGDKQAGAGAVMRFFSGMQLRDWDASAAELARMKNRLRRVEDILIEEGAIAKFEKTFIPKDQRARPQDLASPYRSAMGGSQ